MIRRVLLSAGVVACIAHSLGAQGPRPPVGNAPITTPNAGTAPVTSAMANQGSFTGSVPSEPARAGAIQLTLADSIQRALRSNLGVLTLDHQIDSARAARWRSY